MPLTFMIVSPFACPFLVTIFTKVFAARGKDRKAAVAQRRVLGCYKPKTVCPLYDVEALAR